jgi:hypothetical protein
VQRTTEEPFPVRDVRVRIEPSAFLAKVSVSPGRNERTVLQTSFRRYEER